MSYDENVNNYIIKFKDEKSYLSCRLNYLDYCENENISVELEPTFLHFIQNEMYSTNTCEVEDIEISLYQLEDANSIGNWVVNNDNTYTNSLSTISGGSINGMHVSGNVIIDGTLTVNGETAISNSFFNGGVISYTEPEIDTESKELEVLPDKEEEPEDPIDNRFDILDL